MNKQVSAAAVQPYEPLLSLRPLFEEMSTEYNGQRFSFLVANRSASKMALILHGVTGNKLDMALLGRYLARHGFAVYLPDLPGHGSAPAVVHRQFAELGRWLDDCIRSTGRQPTVVIGNSFGSAVCYSYAQQGLLPEGTALVLNCPTPDTAIMTRMLQATGRLLPDRLAGRVYNANWAVALRIGYLHVSGDDSARHWLKESERLKRDFINPTVSNNMARLLQTQSPYRGPQLSEPVQRRTSYVIGERDNVVTAHTWSIMQRLLPLAERRIVPAAGHILHFDAWHACGDIALEAVNGIGSTP